MPPQPKKRPPLDEIAKRFHLPLMKAAEDLGICQTLLKKFCRQYGIARWPYRKMKSMYMNGNEQVDAQAIEAYINQSTTPGSGGNNSSSSISGHFNDGEDLGDDDEDSEIVHHQQQHYQQQQQQHYSHNSQQQQPQQHYSQNSHHHHHQQQQQQGSYVSSPQQQQQPYPYQQQPPQPQQQSQHHSQYQYPQPYSRHLSSQHQKSHHQQQQGSGQSSYDYRVQSVHNNDERRNSSSSQQQQRFSSNGNSNSSTGGSTTSGSFSFDQLKSSPFQSNNNNSNNNGNRDNNNNNSRVSQLPMSPKNVHLIPPVQPYHPSSNNAVVPASSSNSTPNTPTVYPASPPSSTSSALSPSNHNLSSNHHNINHNNNNNNSHMHDVSVGPHPTQRRVSLHTSGASQQQQESRDRIYPQPSNPLFRSYSSPSNLQFGDNFKQQHQQHGNHHQHHQHHQHQHHGSQHHASRHSLSPVHPSRKMERSKTLSFDHAPPAQLSHMVPPRSQPTSPDYSSSSVRDSSSQQARPSHIPPLQIPSNGNGPQSTLSPQQQQQASSHYGYNHQSIQNVGRTNSSSSTSSNNSSFANNSVPSFSFGFSSQTVTPEEHSQMYGNVEVTTVNSPVSSPRGSDEMSPVSSPVLSFEQFRLSSPTSPPASSKNTLVHHGSHQHLGSYANNSNNHNNQNSHSNNNGINNSNNGSTNSHKSKHGILSSIDSTMRNLFRSKSFTAIPRHQKPTSLENPHNNHMGTSIASKDNLLNHPPPMTRTGSGTLNTTRHPYPSSLKSIGRAYSSECISPTTHSHPNNHFMNSGVSNISADIQSQQPPKLQKLPSINQLFGPIDHLHAKRPSKELHAVESGMLDGQSGFSHHNSGTFTPIQANTRPDSPMRDSQSPNFEPSNTRPSALHNTQLQFSGGNWNNSRSQYQNHYS